MNEKDIIQNVTIKHQAVGTDATKAAVKSVADEVKNLGDAVQSTSVKQETANRRQASALSGFEKLERSVSPAAKALADYERAQRLVGRAVDQNSALQERGAAVLQVFRDRMTAVGTATGDMSKETRLARHELINLSRQAQDVVVGLGSGQSIGTVLLQQGTQIADVFASSGATVRGFFSQAVSWAGRFVTSTAGVVTGVAAMGAAFVAAGAQFSAGQREIDKALSGIGAASGVTRGGINTIAEGAASPFGLSVSEARSAAASFAATGKIYGDNINRATQLTKQFAQAMDLGVGDAAKKLASDLQDPVRAALEWNKTLGFLDAGLLNYIRSLEATGRKQEAIKVLMDAAAPSIAKQAEQVGMLTKAWDAATNFVSNYFQQAGGAYARTAERLTGADLGGFSDEQRLQSARATQTSLRGVDTTGLDAQSMEAYTEAVRRANEEVSRLEKKLEDVSAAARRQDLSLGADAAVRSILPQIDALEKLETAINRIKNAQAEGVGVAGGGAAIAVLRQQVIAQQESLAATVQQAQYVSQLQSLWGGVTSQTALALNNLRGQLGIAQALTGAAQIQAQAHATINSLLAQGVTLQEARKIAAEQSAVAEANATTQVMQQVQALKDQNAMIEARRNGTEASTAAAIAYRTAIESGASETAAAALSSETLKNNMLQAASGTSQMAAGTSQMAADMRAAAAEAASMDASNRANYVRASGDPNMIAGGDSGAYARGSEFSPSVMTQRGTFAQMPHVGGPLFSGSVPLGDWPKIWWGAGAVDEHESAVRKNEEKLQESILKAMKELTDSTDALNETNKVSLNPLYGGRGALEIGYYKAARGLNVVAQGPSAGDQIPFRAMVNGGERITITPAGQTANDNSRTSNTTVVQNFNFGGSQSTIRRSARQAAQGFGQMMAALS